VIVVRYAHRTRLARTFVLCLLVFAVSPVTAPFTICDLTDFTQSHPTDAAHHPGRQIAEAHLKAAPLLITIAFEPVPRPVLFVDGRAQTVVGRDSALEIFRAVDDLDRCVGNGGSVCILHRARNATDNGLGQCSLRRNEDQ